ncbi:MAG: hypothetical protein OI74_07505 [Gammaproteobacteria bacterium (ex Lamellibrachia satsuma)]|nr:MAG: hypothetical protein OI74_07505 [Gammaproteobacteria bacterium (ex Lamellibrachia satsuma)]RRS37614.1 MAG: hypothetical protein NV67_00170 [Gammaproteobacteria bacterium (ex Lamellibrachia satsuma)]
MTMAVQRNSKMSRNEKIDRFQTVIDQVSPPKTLHERLILKTYKLLLQKELNTGEDLSDLHKCF